MNLLLPLYKTVFVNRTAMLKMDKFYSVADELLDDIRREVQRDIPLRSLTTGGSLIIRHVQMPIENIIEFSETITSQLSEELNEA